MTDLTQFIDTVPSTRYPVYARLNAGDVMPDPITPLGATLVWIPEVLPSWAIGDMRLGTFTPHELDGEPFLAGGVVLRLLTRQRHHGAADRHPGRHRRRCDRRGVLR